MNSTNVSPPPLTMCFQYGHSGHFTQIADVSAISLNTWYHFVATYDGNTANAKLYRNGVLVATQAIGTTTISSNTLALNISRNANAPASSFWNGSIAGAAVYNTVLTQSQIYHPLFCWIAGD